MASFYIPLTGLESDSTALNTIANNLANLGSTGYKAQQVDFSDLFYQQLSTNGSGDLIQEGSGTQIAAIESEFGQGSISPTGNASDVALDGNGFFVLNNGGSNVYTRDGNFLLNSSGNLTSQNGQQVMGYPAVAGVVNTNAPLTGINIPVGSVEPPSATTGFGQTANLDATAAIGTAVPAQITMYDSLGVSHIATVTYTKTASDTWSYSIALPAGEATSSTNTTGTLTFGSNGNLTSPTADVTGITFNGLSSGAANLNLTFDLLGSDGKPTITQVSSASGVSATTQNGFPSGQYQTFSVGTDGTVSAVFSNGQSLAVGQLALANVTNLQGLSLLGNGDYSTTLASGQASIGASGSNGLGTLVGGSIEESNVNISQEFSELIITQRSFEANSKAVTTFDTVAEETINMVHG